MNEIVYRTITLELETRGKDSVTATLSTETPVERPYLDGYEVLSHKAGAVNLTRARQGLPLLWSHDPQQIVGRVENIRVEGSKLKGELRAGNSQKAKEIWADVNTGIIKDVSIGYSLDGKPRRDGNNFIYDKWTVFETSLVSIGADTLAGVGR